MSLQLCEQCGEGGGRVTKIIELFTYKNVI
jgi:hypothetical protein